MNPQKRSFKSLQNLAFPGLVLFVLSVNLWFFLGDKVVSYTPNNLTNSLTQLVPWVCPFRFVTGYLCPGCGLTHSFMALIQGQLLQSFAYHPLGPFIHGFLIFMVFDFSFLNLQTSRKFYLYIKTKTNLNLCILASLLIWDFFRNFYSF